MLIESEEVVQCDDWLWHLGSDMMAYAGMR